MKIKDVMNTRVVKLRVTATLAEAAELASLTRASDLMVVDDQGSFVGLLAEGDLIRGVMPDGDEILRSGGSHRDIEEAFIASARDLANQNIRRLLITEPFLLHPSDPLLKAATVMVTRQIRVLAVVEDGKLVGTVSRADICWGLFAGRET